MSLRWTLLEVAARQGWSAEQRGRLMDLASVSTPPAPAGAPASSPAQPARLAKGLGIGGAALLGFALILAVASQWGATTPLQRIQWVMGLLAAALLGAILVRRARVPLALLALLGTGGLFALIGQTYPSGADPWQLFALWAVLCLPLALAAHHDAVWAPWALVAMTGLALWLAAHAERHGVATVPAVIAWAVALAVVAGLSAPARRWTGAGLWSLRTALTLTAFLISGTALAALFDDRHAVHAPYVLGLLAIGAGLALTGSRRAFDVFGLSALALAMNGLLVAGAARLLFHAPTSGDPFGRVLLLGLFAAGLLAVSVSQILRLARGRESAA